MVSFLAIFARILLLQILVQRAAADCLWVVSSLDNLSNEGRFVQRVATVVFGWVDGLNRCSLVCFDYLSTQPTEMPYYKLILYKYKKNPKYGYLAIYIEYNRNLGGSLVGWTNRQKNPFLWPGGTNLKAQESNPFFFGNIQVAIWRSHSRVPSSLEQSSARFKMVDSVS